MSCCGFQVDHFLRDPYSTVKIILPAAAVQALAHCKVWNNTASRALAVGVLVTTMGRLALNVHLSWVEGPILRHLPFLTDNQQLMLKDYRMSMISKLDVVSAMVSLDIFYIYYNRPGVNVPPCVTTLMVVPAAITALQGICLLPNYHRQVARVHDGKSSAADLLADSSFVNRHRVFLGLDFLKVSCLALAGLRFSCMLSK
ncbi:uncharacterized protein BX664DRAFT_333900 [Halteromyces radiatus]|uniref:uncharacterized protein n=1 Tax=Halteromyces radiatus TaxID=101107 RepID=UPI00221F21D6|nr:uncharacterized protein BX664DRAFT_333900 [Halteromyces radiatus]KAI8089793.1 hypothetical protein BX664DRAFT_333900 [Halteromyces radiatus]